MALISLTRTDARHDEARQSPSILGRFAVKSICVLNAPHNRTMQAGMPWYDRWYKADKPTASAFVRYSGNEHWGMGDIAGVLAQLRA